MLDYNSSITALTLLVSVLIFCRSVSMRKRANELSILLSRQTESLEAMKSQLSSNKEKSIQDLDFQSNLKQAEITTNIQKTRSSHGHTGNTRKTPERYQYAQSMFQSGMPTDEISSTLGMSSTEITQLLKLASITCKAEESDKDN